MNKVIVTSTGTTGVGDQASTQLKVWRQNETGTTEFGFVTFRASDPPDAVRRQAVLLSQIVSEAGAEDRYSVVIVDKRDGTASTHAKYYGDAGADAAHGVAKMVNLHGEFVATVVGY